MTPGYVLRSLRDLLQLLHVDVRELERVAVMLEAELAGRIYAGKLRLVEDDLAIQDHRQPVSLHRDDVAIPLAYRVVGRHARSERGTNRERLPAIIANPVDFA